jgi:hypothetical protein
VVIPGAFRESFYKDTVIERVAPTQNRYRKRSPQGKNHSTENRDLSRSPTKNIYENAAPRYIENIWFRVSCPDTIVVLG